MVPYRTDDVEQYKYMRYYIDKKLNCNQMLLDTVTKINSHLYIKEN